MLASENADNDIRASHSGAGRARCGVNIFVGKIAKITQYIPVLSLVNPYVLVLGSSRYPDRISYRHFGSLLTHHQEFMTGNHVG